MGIPLPPLEQVDDTILRKKGFFAARSTESVVGELPEAVFADGDRRDQQLYPILSFPASVVCRAWSDITLHFIYGPTAYGGCE